VDSILDTGENGRYDVRLEVLDSTGRVSTDVTCRIEVSNAG